MYAHFYACMQNGTLDYICVYNHILYMHASVHMNTYTHTYTNAITHMHAYIYGEEMRFWDGILRVLFPRFFSQSMDYPEK